MRPSGFALAGLVVACGLAVTGCARLEHPTATPQPSVSVADHGEEFASAPSPSASPTPARAAGGACTLVDYDSVQAATGTRFQVAAASDAHGADSCALQVLYSDHPDLVLAVAGTKADGDAFVEAEPDGVRAVDGLGDAAYSRVLGPQGDAGPAVQVVWLGKDSKIVTMTYTYPGNVGTQTASSHVGELVDYARKVESRR